RLRRAGRAARRALSLEPGDSMTDRRLDVLAIGNAIVDVIANADDAFLAAEGMHKGAMRLIDESEADRLYAAMGPARELSGGSAANTVAGLASLGRSEEHTSELQSRSDLVCRLLLEKKKK